MTKLVPGKEVLVPTMCFGRSLVTEKMIKLFEKKRYFSEGVGMEPGDEEVPKPKHGDAIIFRDFFTTGLRFPCDSTLP